MADYQCSYCKLKSGKTIIKGVVKPALSDRGCPKSPSGKHKWVKI